MKGNCRILILSFLFLSILCLGVVSQASAIDVEKVFREANTFYGEGDWDNAARLYESLVRERPHSAALYYNLGNTYYRMDELGEARLNFERAHYLNPRDSEIRSNLNFVEGFIEYKIEDKRNWYLLKLSALLGWLTFNELLLLTLIFYLIVLGALFINLFLRRRLIGRFSIGVCAIFFIMLLCVIFRYTYSSEKRSAIVTQKTAEVRYGPSRSDKAVFSLVEGMKVSIKKKRGDWYLIQMVNKESGWVRAADVETLVPPRHLGFSLDMQAS